MAHLSIRTLGSLQIRVAGNPVTEFHSDKVRALLAYLAVEADQPHRRGKLAGLLWPDYPERSARTSLRSALAHLRQVIGDQAAEPPFLLITRQTIQFNCTSDWELDVHKFSCLLEAKPDQSPGIAELEQAAALYRGDFLDGFSIPDSILFEEWALVTRQSLRAQALSMLHQLAGYYQEKGDRERALRFAQRQLALDPYHELAHQQVMWLLALNGKRNEALAHYENYREALETDLNAEPLEETQEMYVRLLEGVLPGLPVTTLIVPREPRTVGECPYRGLGTFREVDAPFFFGRESFTARLSEAVRKRLLVAVIVGSSGSGKSSTVYAGLLPELRAGGKWLIVDLRPGGRPIQSMVAALLPLIDPRLSESDRLLEIQKLAKAIDQGELPLHDLVARALEKNPEAERMLLVVDQFEELYTLCPDEEVRQRFLDELLSLSPESAERKTKPYVLLLTLRADFMGQVLAYRPFADTLQEASLILGPMNREEMQAVIEMPAKQQGAAFESGLVERLLDDVGEEPGNLPLLEFCLTLLWERMDQGWITHASYDEIGRVDGALARYAEQVYAGLNETDQALAQRIFIQLVQPGQGTEDTRRVADRGELDAEDWSLIQYLANKRLVVTSQDEAGNETVEVVHEALIRSWGRFGDWMNADRVFRTWQEGLRVAMRQWRDSDKDSGALLRGTPLAQAEDWLIKRGMDLSQTEKDYIQASLAARQDREAVEAERQAHEAALERRSRNFLRTLAVVLAVAAIVAVVLSAVAFNQRNIALAEADNRATQQAIAQELQANAEQEARAVLETYSLSLAGHAENALEDQDTSTALMLAAFATQMEDPPAETLHIFRAAAYAPGPRQQLQVAELFPDISGQIFSLAANPMENTFLIGFEDGTIILWDLSSQSEILRLVGHKDIVRDIAFSPDGLRALSGGDDHQVILWDLATGNELQRFTGHNGWVRAVAFSPDERLAASGGFAGDSIYANLQPGELFLWDLHSGKTIHRFEGGDNTHPSGVQDIAFSPDGQALLVSFGIFSASKFDYGLELLDVHSGEELQSFPVDHDNFSITISPDGKRALTGGSDSNLHLWDLESGEELQVLSGHLGLITSVVLSADGSKALTADWAGRVLLWDLEMGAQRLHVHGHQVNVAWTGGNIPPTNAVIASDGQQALSSAGDGTLVIWDLHDAGEIRRFEGHEAPLSTVRFTPDGKYVLTGSGRLDLSVPPYKDNSIKLWEVESGALLRVFEGHTDTILPLDISQDGTRMLSGSRDGSMKLWDLESGEEMRSFAAQPSGVFVLSLSPDGRRAISGPVGPWPWEPLMLWDLETGEVVQRIPLNDDIATSVEINPDGLTAYTTAGDLALIDLESGQFIREYATLGRPCYDFARSPDRKSIFITGYSLLEWDLENDQLVRKFWEHAGSRSRVEITADGRLLLSSDAAGNLYLWDTQTGDQLRHFKSDNNDTMFFIDMTPDGRYAISPGGHGSAILWDLSLPIELEEVRAWISKNRFLREPTCAERETFSIEPLCEQD